MPEKESMRPQKNKALLTSICAITICALATAGAGFAMTSRASVRSTAMTSRARVRSPAHQRMAVTWISGGVQEPKLNRQWAEATSGGKPGRLGEVSDPFLRLLGGSVLERPTSAHGSVPVNAADTGRNWWDEHRCQGPACPFMAPRTILTYGASLRPARHHRPRPPSHRRESCRARPPGDRARPRPGADIAAKLHRVIIAA
jgi:hypothetical protein